VILPFNGKTCILEIIVKKLMANKMGIPVIVATTHHNYDDRIVALCKHLNVPYFRGSEPDVLKRFVDTAHAFNLNTIIRVCSDNPFLDVPTIETLVRHYQEAEQKPDYLSFTLDGDHPVIKSHIGLFTELIPTSVLEELLKLKNLDKIYHEHVTNFIYAHPGRYRSVLLPVPSVVYENKEKENMRLTLDTLGDFVLLQKIYKQLILSKPEFTLQDLVDFLVKNPVYIEEMKTFIFKNPK
jgi:spore coat polysaccharide biosynthesis protein SpsF